MRPESTFLASESPKKGGDTHPAAFRPSLAPSPGGGCVLRGCAVRGQLRGWGRKGQRQAGRLGARCDERLDMPAPRRSSPTGASAVGPSGQDPGGAAPRPSVPNGPGAAMLGGAASPALALGIGGGAGQPSPAALPQAVCGLGHVALRLQLAHTHLLTGQPGARD